MVKSCADGEGLCARAGSGWMAAREMASASVACVGGKVAVSPARLDACEVRRCDLNCDRVQICIVVVIASSASGLFFL